MRERIKSHFGEAIVHHHSDQQRIAGLLALLRMAAPCGVLAVRAQIPTASACPRIWQRPCDHQTRSRGPACAGVGSARAKLANANTSSDVRS